MDRKLLNEFVDYVEKQTGLLNPQTYVQDEQGVYQKDLYIKNVIADAKELIGYGEGVIAIENMLDNLYEVSLTINTNAIELLRKAFDEKVPDRIEETLNAMLKK